MKTIYLSNVLLLVVMFLLSCQMKDLNGYDKCQTFNEFELKGVNSPNLQPPFIFLKKESDTIFVIKSNKKDETIKYVNKGRYWYSSTKLEEKPTFEERFFGVRLKIERFPQICEKYIFNDTIIEYVYLIGDKSQRFMQNIYVKTKNSILYLSIQDDDIKNTDDPYMEIINFVHNYKALFLYYTFDYQPIYYRFFEKQISGGTFCLYEINGGKKKLQYSIKLNSLGEFDLSPGIGK